MIFLKLLFTFLKIGAFTFGGGLAMLPLVEEAVLSNGWMDAQQIADFFAISESTPGPFAINMATYVGSLCGGEYGLWGTILGAFMATLGVVLPSFVIILLVAKFFEKFKDNKYVKGCMSGLKPASVGLIASAVITVALAAFFNGEEWSFSRFLFDNNVISLGLSFSLPESLKSLSFIKEPSFYVALALFAIALFVVMKYKKLSPIFVIIGSAAVGIGAGYLFNIQI
ncbi:MAG: chromate transporter [Ruminococcaceae bacterium]|nr:chromate transporter [Oscillospiraceae bacterium]